MTKELIVNINGMNISVKDHRKIRICIGIPVGDSISPIFFRTMLLRMEEWSQIFDIVPVIETSMPIDEARNNIVKIAIDYECDYIFFIDSDTLIQQGQLEKLLSYNKDAITGISYMKVPPYYTLIRKKVGYRIYSPIEPLSSDTELISIDGAGLGCFLVKTSVLNNIKYPWFRWHFFKYEDKWRHIGEDLFFCEQLKDINVDIYCDPTVQCIHIGTDVTTDIANRYKDLKLSILEDIKRCKEELSEFTGIPFEKISNKCDIATESTAEQYKHQILDLDKDPKNFYKENKDYIFDLVNWHMQQRKAFDTNLIDEIKNKYPSTKKILDFGCGSGDNALDLAKVGYDVAMTDYDGYTSEFARFRAKKRGLNIKFYDIEMPINDKFDIILAFDVLEHIPDTEFEKIIYLLKSLKTENGKILTTTSFGTQGGLHPMHYESSSEKIMLIETLNS